MHIKVLSAYSSLQTFKVISIRPNYSDVMIFRLRDDLYCVGWGVKLY